MAQVQIVGEDLLIDGVAVMAFKEGVGYYEKECLRDWIEHPSASRKSRIVAVEE
jgi:hypothetical protein